MSLLEHFMKYPAEAALVYRMCATEGKDPQKEQKITIYPQDVNYLSHKVATDDEIAEAEPETQDFKQTKDTTALRYSTVLQEKALHCDCVCEDARLKTFCRRTA